MLLCLAHGNTFPRKRVALGDTRSPQTLRVEHLLKHGRSAASVAREVGISRIRVRQIHARMLDDYSLVTGTPAMAEPHTSATSVSGVVSHSPMVIAITLTTAVHDALVAACAIANRQSPEDPITIAEYTEELIINRTMELGLLRKRGKQ